MSIKRLNKEVFSAKGPIVKIGNEDVEFLKEEVQYNERHRIRLCTHENVEDTLHEMLIVLNKGIYIRPHKHLSKSESFHIVEGLVNVIIFDQEGKIVDVIPMGAYPSAHKFYYRLSPKCYHTPIIVSDIVVFHETTNGPFTGEDTVFAPWAPNEQDSVGVEKFMYQLTTDIAALDISPK